MSAATFDTRARLKNFLAIALKVWDAWKKAYDASEKSEAVIVSKFLKNLKKPLACRLFGLTALDFQFLVNDQITSWRYSSLNRVRAKIAIHVKSCVEALEALGTFSEGGFKQTDKVRHKLDDLRATVTWMEIYTKNGQRILELAIKENRFQNLFEISPIDTELFAACWLIELDSFENAEIKLNAERKLAHVIEQNLFGNISPVVIDSANLWWALKLATKHINESIHPILDKLPGGKDDALGKCIQILNLACLQEINTPQFGKNVVPHPLDYTPEIYQKEKTYSFILLNSLNIQCVLSSNSTFRRTQAYWHILEKLDRVVNKCWAVIKNADFEKTNLYILSLLNRAIANWLIQSRTKERWMHLMQTNFSEANKNRLACSDIIEKLNKHAIKGVVTANSVFCYQVEEMRGKMLEFVKSHSYNHPFTIAICGPPGSGKTHLAKKLLSHAGITAAISTYNLASHYPSSDDIWSDCLKTTVSSGVLKDGGQAYPFQAVIIDEADSLNPQHVIDHATCAYQWLLEPLWEKWPKYENGAIADPKPHATFVFVISSRYWTWSKWYHDALKANVSKGRDFVSRIDESVDLPSMSPEDQLLMAATLFEGEGILHMSKRTANIIALATFENQGRSIETLKKQCKLAEAKKNKYLNYKKHFPQSGNFRSEALTMREYFKS